MAMTEALKKAQRKYEKKMKNFHLKLRIDNDADIIAWLKEQESANARIKELIRSDIHS